MNRYGVNKNGEILTYEKVENNECNCIKCGGTGKIEVYNYIENGVCFKCGGSGRQQLPIKTYTLEDAEIKAKKIIDNKNSKYALKIEECNRKDREKSIFNKDLYAVLGDLEDIEKELKSNGAKWNDLLQTYTFTQDKKNYNTLKITYADVTETCEIFPNDSKLSGIYRDMQDLGKIAKLRDYINNTRTHSKHIGQPKDKIEVEVTLSKVTGFSSNYGYTNIYIFEDADKNILTWTTSKDMENWEEGQQLTIKATIKAHEEYRGEKQTSILRVKQI